MRYLFLIFLLTSAFSQDLVKKHLGNEKAPHVLFQIKSGEVARNYLIEQIYAFLSENKNGTNLYKSNVKLENSEIPILLMMKGMKDNLSEILNQSLLLNFGSADKFTPEEMETISKGKLPETLDDRFLNRMMLNLKLKKLSYEIDPAGLELKEFSTRIEGDELKVDLRIDFSKIKVNADDICININTFKKINGTVKKVKSNYDCNKENKTIEDQVDDFLESYLETRKIEAKVIDTESPDYLTDIGATLKDIVLKISNEAPMFLKLSYSLKSTPEGIVGKIESGSIDKIMQHLTEVGLQENIDLEFNNDKVVHINGLSGFSIQGSPLLFSDKDLNEALQTRKKELMNLILTPIEKTLQKAISENQENGALNKEILLAGKIKTGKESSNINYSVDQLSFLGHEGNNEYIGAGINFDFGTKDQRFSQVGYSWDQEKINQYIGDDLDLQKGHMVLSISEEFFNELIDFSLEKFGKQIEGTPFKPENIKFHIDQYSQSSLDLNNSKKVEFPYITGCVGFAPPKGIAKLGAKLVGGKNGVKIPLLAYSTLSFANNSEDVPELSFNIDHIESEKEFLLSDQNCKVSKIFKKLVAKMAKKNIDKSFNGYSDHPLVKLEIPALKGISKNIVNLVFDKEMKRIHIIISFSDLPNIKEQITKRFESSKEKIRVTFPKIEKLTKK